MNENTISVLNTEESVSEQEIPDDIDLEKRKNFVREQLRAIFGKRFSERLKQYQKNKQQQFNHKKRRRKIAQKSQRRNRG